MTWYISVWHGMVHNAIKCALQYDIEEYSLSIAQTDLLGDWGLISSRFYHRYMYCSLGFCAWIILYALALIQFLRSNVYKTITVQGDLH